MRKLQISDSEIMSIAIQEEIVRSQESRYDHRLHGLLLVAHGLSCYHVAEWLGQDPRTVQRWVHRFERNGFVGLQEGQRTGRPRRLTNEQLSDVNLDLRTHPRDLGYEQNLWDGKLLAHHLAKLYGVELSVRQCQRIFGRLGFRRREPRGVIAKADPEAQAAFKKTAAAGRRRHR